MTKHRFTMGFEKTILTMALAVGYGAKVSVKKGKLG
jgi:hypothetical protein